MKKISIMILLLVVALASCKKTPEVNLKYVDVERDLVTVGTTTANIQCDYAYIVTLKKAYLYYGESENEDAFTSAEMRVVQNTLYVELTGLKANTTYSYYYEFHNGFNSMRTVLKSFKTEAGNGGGEEPPTPEITLPTVITASVTEIAANSAKGGGEVTNDGGAEVTERGICWSNSANPTISNSHIAAGTGIGEFATLMDGLDAGTTYHVRAYAINEAGTAYGLDKEFTTLNGGGSGEAPEGAINGLFTINENGDQVYFSQGNLQYQASTNTWRFAEHQWDYVGTMETNPYQPNPEGNVPNSSNHCISATYDGWIDLFGWGTSGYNGKYPYMTSSTNTDYGDGNNNIAGTNYDWGVYNMISNGGNTTNTWRTLTNSEWGYVFSGRTTSSGLTGARANVNNVNGVILLPDNWSTDYYSLYDTDDFNTNIITDSQWVILEQHGAVFLPAAGYRGGTSVYYVNNSGYYWSALLSYSFSPFFGFFNDWYINMNNSSLGRCNGLSVRLVRDY